MDSNSGGNGTGGDHQSCGWPDSAQYQHMDTVSTYPVDPSTDSSMVTQYASLSTLQGDFVTIQSADGGEYPGGFQQVYMSGHMVGEGFENMASDVDYVVTTNDEGLSSLRVLDKQHVVPYLLTDQSQSQDNSVAHWAAGLSLGSYMHGFGDNIVVSSATSVSADQTANLLMSQQGLNVVSTGLTADGSTIVLNHSNMTSTATSQSPSQLLEMMATAQSGGSGLVLGTISSAYSDINVMSAASSKQEQQQQQQTLPSMFEGRDISQPPPSYADISAEKSKYKQVSTDVDDDEDDDDFEASPRLSRAAGEHTEVRKSERIAHRERSPSPSVAAVYVSKPYNATELWCEDCQTSYDTECTKHKLQPTSDRIVLSRAWASLPSQLHIFRLTESADGQAAELGVFAKKAIPKRMQFGPLVAPTVDRYEDLTSTKFPLVIDKADGTSEYVNAVHEDQCNWMMFVRPAATFQEQNLVAYQHGTEIYFATTMKIEPRQELKVWYAAHYAERLKVNLLPKPTDAPAVDESELAWPCYECSERFRSSALLQKHLAVHDEDDGGSSLELAAANDPPCIIATSRRATGRRRGRPRTVRPESSGDDTPQNSTDAMAATGNSGEFQSWKKRKTNMYLKMKKYKEPIKRSIKMLNRRSKFANYSSECTTCGLAFETMALLDIHSVLHTADTNTDISGENALTQSDNVSLAPLVISSADVSSAAVINDGSEPTDTPGGATCPACNVTTDSAAALATHVTESHGVTWRQRGAALAGRRMKTRRPFRCPRCWKTFEVEEKCKQHLISHAENLKTFQCETCERRFMNNSALACHKKTHSTAKYYTCPLCHDSFEQIHVLRSHAERHADPNTGLFSCPSCHKSFDTFSAARRHARNFHSNSFPCAECGRTFPRADKLRLHQLRHSSHREFMCESCGRQFKRKDKLREHVKRSHRGVKATDNGKPGRRSATHSTTDSSKIPPTEFEQFIFKCHDCQLGFKRRGMLVNHLAKRHPEISVASVPELNMPIIRATRDFYCQYCEKVYKSSAKRKMHILKAHPGAELPAAMHRSGGGIGGSDSASSNPTFSATVGSIVTVAHACNACHKQYASKPKLLQHQRKKHGSSLEAGGGSRRQLGLPLAVAGLAGTPQTVGADIVIDGTSATASKLLTAAMISRCLSEGGEIQIIPQGGDLTDADLLTQAMNELTQSFGTEYRVVAASTSGIPGDVLPCVVNVSNGTALVQSIVTNTSDLSGAAAVGLSVAQQQRGGVAGVGRVAGQPNILHTIPRSLASTFQTAMEQQQQQQRTVNLQWVNNFQNF